MAVFQAMADTGGVTHEQADKVGKAVVPQAGETAKAAQAEVPARPLPLPMPAAQRLSVIWLREARKA